MEAHPRHRRSALVVAAGPALVAADQPRVSRCLRRISVCDMGAWSVDLTDGVFMGLITATAVGWTFGGSIWLRHFVLRLLAWRHGDMPWRYVDFLDHATACILLQRVGGGYVFIHRKLLEHFA